MVCLLSVDHVSASWLPKAEIITIQSRPSVKQNFLFADARSQRAIIIFPSHKGLVRFKEQNGGFKIKKGGYGGRVAPFLWDQNISLAVMASPSDRPQGMNTKFRLSARHATDVNNVIKWLRQKGHSAVYLMGSCRGGFSPVGAAANLGADRVDGLILASTRSRGDHGSILDLAVGSLKSKVLLLHHRKDDCYASPYSAIGRITNFLSSLGSNVTLVKVEGGSENTVRKGRRCGSLGPHGFLNKEVETAKAIVKWLISGTARNRITKKPSIQKAEYRYLFRQADE